MTENWKEQLNNVYKKLEVVFMDLSKDFKTVKIILLWEKLKAYGFSYQAPIIYTSKLSM